MALRIRKNGKVLCAAMHEAEQGDIYIDDGIHYELSVVVKVLVTEPMILKPDEGRGGHKRHGEWWWINNVPKDVIIENLK